MKIISYLNSVQDIESVHEIYSFMKDSIYYGSDPSIKRTFSWLEAADLDDLLPYIDIHGGIIVIYEYDLREIIPHTIMIAAVLAHLKEIIGE